MVHNRICKMPSRLSSCPHIYHEIIFHETFKVPLFCRATTDLPPAQPQTLSSLNDIDPASAFKDATIELQASLYINRVDHQMSTNNSYRMHMIVLIVLVCSSCLCSGRRDLSSKTKATLSPRNGMPPWKKIWSDEFDYFDPSKWEYQLEDGCKLGVCSWGNKEKVRPLVYFGFIDSMADTFVFYCSHGIQIRTPCFVMVRCKSR